MQQFAIQPYVDRDEHGAGSAFLAILLAENCCSRGRDSTVDCEEWGSNLHHLDARNPCRSWISAWQPAPAWRRYLFSVGTVGGGIVTVVIGPQ